MADDAMFDGGCMMCDGNTWSAVILSLSGRTAVSLSNYQIVELSHCFSGFKYKHTVAGERLLPKQAIVFFFIPSYA
jgi:hypothetical protein